MEIPEIHRWIAFACKYNWKKASEVNELVNVKADNDWQKLLFFFIEIDRLKLSLEMSYHKTFYFSFLYKRL